MSIEIKPFHVDFLPDQVALGQEVMDGWKYQSQTSLELLQEIYSKDDFRSETRLYAFVNDELVGFQTSSLLKEEEEGKIVARMEFPIVRGHDWDIIDLLQEQSEATLRQLGVDLVRVRVSPHWGQTPQLAKKYGFQYEKPHLMTTSVPISQLEMLSSHEYQIMEVSQDNSQAVSHFKEIFPQRFPMRYEGEIDKWFNYYVERDPLVWLILLEDGYTSGHLIGFKQEETVAFTALFSLNENPGQKLQELLSYAIKQVSGVKYVSLSIGDAQVPYAKMLNSLGLDLTTQVSYHIKSLG